MELFQAKVQKLEFHDIHICNFLIRKISLYINSYYIYNLSALVVSMSSLNCS